MPPRRLALVVGQLQAGGAERQIHELAVRIDRGRYDPTVICLSSVTDPFGPMLVEAGIPVEVIQRSRHNDIGRALRLARLIRARRFEVAHSFLIAANAYTWAACAIVRGPAFIASSRTCIPPRGRWAPMVHGRAFRAAAAVIANSRSVAEFTRDLYGLAEGRIRVIPNGVDCDRFGPPRREDRAAARAELGAGDGHVLAGTLGRLSPEKNLGLLLRAAARIAASPGGDRFRFVVAGDGPALGDLRRKAEDLGIADRVSFPGLCRDVPRLLAALDLFVTTSDTEGMPNAVMEAMAARLPVVATRVGGTEEVVREGDTGFLVAPGDEEGVADRVARIAADPLLRRGLGDRGRARIESEFSVRRMVDRTVDLYDEVSR